eukprot:TRINITY_DN8955_c0_g1_i1.p1 TRINITY_DN8955_c0_g1~~TRINITY_DN8955_c0_g1_i1.p1  ORF type:complete len:140 (-),score=18.09 TRINITY_DN8955_c0_g1_i1:122-541(-)
MRCVGRWADRRVILRKGQWLGGCVRRYYISTDAPKVLILSGPTASGKSKLATQLASKFNGELISADSIKVYKGLDIGSNKTGLLEAVKNNHVPLHMVDIVDINTSFSMGQYANMARQLTTDMSLHNPFTIPTPPNKLLP